jgi:hypothetical protein
MVSVRTHEVLFFLKVHAVRAVSDRLRADRRARRVECFAGKLAYSRYGFFKRQLMRYIAWREGAPTDARRDYEFTDWTAVRRFALEVAADVFHSGQSAAVRRVVSGGGKISAPLARFCAGKTAGFSRLSAGTARHESCLSGNRGSKMSQEDRRLALDQGFDLAVETVLTAFLAEGFAVEPVEGGDLQRRGTAVDRLRYTLLEATLPELGFVPCRCIGGLPAILGCHIALFELTGMCTLVTASSPLARYPLLASLVPRLSDRAGNALHQVAARGASLEAA